jgi:hypothetical protein
MITIEAGLGMEETELYREMAKLDRELLAMIKADPDLEEIYVEEMGEAPGSVVYLPRAPTPEDWARAQELANRK